ncbi:hypothetical protein Mag101_17265 [Microbulbifer agarilyticus]|uniref:DUF3800 domain-containing protein n=1 Tax=Microbulbifer agarilyticus TaxID=260552 RepID=A0A1Q2M927_9GAMM|nr:DUF3800 domain-containing protein [Microbulbifer agarilyticus]AQQ69184.1 hypothetical protein Mag101_17265 [Microbulbifer agarilyticus]
MSEFNLYCDESRHTSDPSQKFAVIGAIHVPREKKHSIVGRLHNLMAIHNAHGEFGWKRLSPNRAAFYFELIDLFINEEDLRFRCLIADKTLLDHNRYNEGDSELGFYKLYYQMLVHWMLPGNTYHLYLDWQQNSASGRFQELRSALRNKLSGRAHVACLESVTSHSQPLVQLADLFMGAVGYKWNRLDQLSTRSEIKTNFSNDLAEKLGRPTLESGTYPSEEKFNIFHWQGRS